MKITLCLLLLLSLVAGNVFASDANIAVIADNCPAPHDHAAPRFNETLATSSLITWFPEEITCPVCQTKNIFMVVGSYGSYIYQYPSKYQLIFWPYTDNPSWYSCKKCRYTAFMGGFDKVPKEKLAELRKMLEGVQLPAQKERSQKESMEKPPYLEIPTADRLIVAEKVYRLLRDNDDDFWNHFYRVQAYHFDGHKRAAEADEARKKSLALSAKALADTALEGRRKEYLYLSGAMKHFLHDDTGATKDFETAKPLKYSDKDLTAEQSENYNGFIATLIDDYLKMLKNGEGPRLKAAKGDH
jgi:hypothetical protein